MATKITNDAAELPIGSRSAPSLNFNQSSSDSNTGIWNPAADTIEIVEGGNAVILIDSAGDVGIGMTFGSGPTPEYKLDVNGDVNFRNFVRVDGYAGVPGQVLQSTGYGATWANLETVFNYLTIGLNTTGIGSAQGGDLRRIYYTSSDTDTIDLSSTDLYSSFTTTQTTSLSIDSTGNLIVNV
jgi:hypothetical protein